MRTLTVSLLSGLLGGVLARQKADAPPYGDMPYEWAQDATLWHARFARQADWLGEMVGCTQDRHQGAGYSTQCEETFLWVGPNGRTELALGKISNIQVEGYVKEARQFTGTVGTKGTGRIDRGVILDGDCIGNTDVCVVKLGRGWEFRSRPNALYLVDPSGRTAQTWNSR